MKITLKGGDEKVFADGMSLIDMAKAISPALAKKALGAIVDGKTEGLFYKVDHDAKVTFVTFNDDEGRAIYRHTSSHIMAQAIKRLYKDVKLAIGPAIENGFYYDFDIEHVFTPDDFPKIEREIKNIIKENYKIERFELKRDEALKFMKDKGEIYKVDLIENLPLDAVISFYKQGEFVDLCAGPHLMSTGCVKEIKLLSVAGAYWRGDEKNKMLQRIYATSFDKKSKMDEYVAMLEEAKKSDHR